MLQPVACIDHRRDGKPLIHCIQNILRPGLDSHPNLLAARAPEVLDGSISHQVGAGLNLEGNRSTSPIHLVSKFAYPSMIERKNVVGEPDMLSTCAPLQVEHFIGNGGR